MSASKSFDRAVNDAMFSMESMFRETPRHELFGSVLAVGWLLGGMIGDESLYLISMVVSTLIFVITLLQVIFTRTNINVIHVGSFRRLIIGLLAHWMYTSGSNQGKEILDMFGQEIPILNISQLIIAFLFLLWILTKYADNIDKNGFQIRSTPFLFIRGLLRGVIQICALFAIVNFEIFTELGIVLYGCYLIEPYIYYVWAKLNKSISSSDMVLGDIRLPSVALRESFMANLVLLFITMSFDGVFGSEWDLLRVYYILGLIYFIVLSWDDIKKFNKNPLASSIAGEFLNNTPDILGNLDLSQQKGIMVDKERMVNLGNSVNFDLKPGSIIIPLEETKGKTTAMIIGKSEKIVRDGKELLKETQEGITTALIPSKELNKLRKDFVTQKLSEINLDELKLPSVAELQKLISLFSENAGNWIMGIKKELKKFDLTSYGIREMNGVTMVNLPGISVVDGKDLTSVKIGPIRVLETPNAEFVRIGGLVNIVEFPKVSFVSLPGITVMDVPSGGSAVDIFGFKISDNLPAEYLDEFKDLFANYIQKLESQLDDQIGKILANSNASVSLNMTWDGEFQPLLKDNRGLINGRVDIDQLTGVSSKALPAAPSEDNEVRNKLAGLIGLDQSREKSRDVGFKGSRKSSRQEEKTRRQLEKAQRKLERAQSKIEKVAGSDNTVKMKLNEISNKIEETKQSIGSNEELEEPRKIIDVDYEVENADYEIIDEDEHEK